MYDIIKENIVRDIGQWLYGVVIVESKEHICCFFGHRKIEVTDELVIRLNDIVEDLIVEKKFDTFLFGSKSQFDKLCLEVVTEMKKKKTHIRRIYVRAEFPYIDEDYTAYLLKMYDNTYYPERMINAGKAAYVERNYEMINNSNYCVIYYDKNYMPPRRKNSRRDLFDYQPSSGTKLAYDYAVKKKLKIVNVIWVFDVPEDFRKDCHWKYIMNKL